MKEKHTYFFWGNKYKSFISNVILCSKNEILRNVIFLDMLLTLFLSLNLKKKLP
jgi:hypothetical protein